MSDLEKIQVQGTLYNIADAEARQVVKVSDTEPTEPGNKIWVSPASQEIQIPTYTEFEDLEDDVADLRGAITEPSYNLYAGKIAGASINQSGTIGSSTLNDLFYAPVEAGKTYSIRLKNDTTSTVIGFFESEPTAIGDRSYNSSRTTIGNGISFIAPITGWVAYRENTGFEQPQINEGETLLPYAGYLTAKDYTARAKLDNMDGVETGNIHYPIVPVVSTGAGKYVKNNGEVNTNNSLNMTDPIELDPGFTITVKAAGSSVANSMAIIASASDEGYNPLVLNSNGNTVAEYTHTAETAEQIVISYLISVGVSVTITGNLINATNIVRD